MPVRRLLLLLLLPLVTVPQLDVDADVDGLEMGGDGKSGLSGGVRGMRGRGRRRTMSIVSITDDNNLFVRVWRATDSKKPIITTV